MAKPTVYFGLPRDLLSVRPMVDHTNGVREHMGTGFVALLSGSSMRRRAVCGDMIDANHLDLELWVFHHPAIPDEPVLS